MEAYSLENFMTFCDDYQIAEEGVLETIKNALIKAFTAIINKLQNLLRKTKDSKVKVTLMKLLHRAKAALNKSKVMTDEKTAEDLEAERDEIVNMMNSLYSDATVVTFDKPIDAKIMMDTI